ncbi:hypothetical protein FRC09_002523 [Ceratobasidium sp. 395]|nr:hypothetical protein FRC09_005569 [Ceratobasidium sp. 395]KAG8706208.1 hypothetical protein FRC09_002523 [Ceratobasidium sp. 395]
MGVFFWHQWARLVALTAGIYGVWAGFWGILFRKFFWDFIGGVLFAPPKGAANPFSGGMIPAKSAAPFIAIIVTIPLVQIVTIIMALTLALLEGTNVALYSLTAAIGYIRAQMKGELMEEAKENRGKEGARA